MVALSPIEAISEPRIQFDVCHRLKLHAVAPQHVGGFDLKDIHRCEIKQGDRGHLEVHLYVFLDQFQICLVQIANEVSLQQLSDQKLTFASI
jgi:hypothetical protein